MAWELVAGGGWKGSEKCTRKGWENGQDKFLMLEKRWPILCCREQKVWKDLPTIMGKSENVPHELVDLAIYLHLYLECWKCQLASSYR